MVKRKEGREVEDNGKDDEQVSYKKEVFYTYTRAHAHTYTYTYSR